MITAVRNAIVGGITLIAALSGHAQAEQVDIFVLGSGTNSCGQFLQAADSERKARPRYAEPGAMVTLDYVAFESWATGFLSGVNWEKAQERSKDAMAGSSSSDHFVGAMVWIENYCRQHPFVPYFEAVFNLRNTLAAKERQ